MGIDGVRSAFNDCMVPYWLAALAVELVLARGRSPTEREVEDALAESLDRASKAMRIDAGIGRLP